MSLFWKIFVSFMIAMTVTSVGAIFPVAGASGATPETRAPSGSALTS